MHERLALSSAHYKKNIPHGFFRWHNIKVPPKVLYRVDTPFTVDNKDGGRMFIIVPYVPVGGKQEWR
jgi:hypothetical protein